MEILKTYKLKFKLFTPLFIGSGDEIDPFELVPINENEFARIDVGKLIEDFSPVERQSFWDYINRNNIVSLRKLLIKSAQSRLNKLSDKSSFIRYRLKSTKEFYENYHNKIDSPSAVFPTLEFIKHPDGRAYIPGSSIKGAIRTAVLNHLYSPTKTKIFTQDNSAGEYLTKDVLKKIKTPRYIEPAILNYLTKKTQRDGKVKISADFSLDPFRLIRVSDVQLPQVITLTLANCYNVSKKRGIEGSAVPIQAETL
ncbi:MAG: type III-A CRISPR-associated RAMP protein Csm5, partial [Candidatus Sumerlaeia bacterium]|nr:type III-A CRISPR-associated RAMP protein Csm5 [Candidatus Sumerlaeia bacterium]